MPRFAIKTPPQHTDWQTMLDVWRLADQIELFDTAWNFDHFYPIHVDPDGPCMESWVTLSALSQATSRIRIGCMVHGMHFRHPAITASMAASLDIVSGGRLNLGLGAGWYHLEADAYGLPLGSVEERMDRFDEGVEVIARLLTQEETTFHGRYYHLTDARCEPKGPQQPRPPIAIGGQGEKRTLRTVARWAHWWDALRIEPEDWPRKHEVLVGYCEEIGRDPSEITNSAHIFWMPDSSPGELAERAAALFEAGLDAVVLSMRAPFAVSSMEPVAEAIAELL